MQRNSANFILRQQITHKGSCITKTRTEEFCHTKPLNSSYEAFLFILNSVIYKLQLERTKYVLITHCEDSTTVSMIW